MNDADMALIIQTAIGIARVLPRGAGLYDPKSAIKCDDEWNELVDRIAAGDWLGAVLEVADSAYYAAKAVQAGLWSLQVAKAKIALAAGMIGLSCSTIPRIMLAKYRERMAGTNTDDAAERQRVIAVLDTTISANHN